MKTAIRTAGSSWLSTAIFRRSPVAGDNSMVVVPCVAFFRSGVRYSGVIFMNFLTFHHVVEIVFAGSE